MKSLKHSLENMSQIYVVLDTHYMDEKYQHSRHIRVCLLPILMFLFLHQLVNIREYRSTVFLQFLKPGLAFIRNVENAKTLILLFLKMHSP